MGNVLIKKSYDGYIKVELVFFSSFTGLFVVIILIVVIICICKCKFSCDVHWTDCAQKVLSNIYPNNLISISKTRDNPKSEPKNKLLYSGLEVQHIKCGHITCGQRCVQCYFFTMSFLAGLWFLAILFENLFY